MCNAKNWLLLAVAAAMLPAAAWAQSARASLAGSVTDPTGAVVTMADISLVSLETGVKTTVKTGADGSYVLPNLPVGKYELRATAAGFKEFRQSGLQLNTFDKVRVDVQLELGSTSETVEVRANASQLNFDTPEQKAGVAPETLSELPLMVSNGVRSSASFLMLLPGTATPTNDAGAARVNGGQSMSGATILNGGTLLNPSGQQGIISATWDYYYWVIKRTFCDRIVLWDHASPRQAHKRSASRHTWRAWRWPRGTRTGTRR